jgi:hypothetical protein
MRDIRVSREVLRAHARFLIWADFPIYGAWVTLSTGRHASVLMTPTPVALLPWNRNRRPKVPGLL